MPEDKLYEYAVIRLVPRVEREEFLNVGLVMFSKKEKFIRTKIHFDSDKSSSILNNLDVEELLQSLHNFEKISAGDTSCGPIAQLDIPERFRWLTAVRSSIVQTSRPHPGLSKNLEATFERLFREFVL